MASTPPPPTNAGASSPPSRRRATSVSSITQSAIEFTEDLVLHRDPPLGFVAATAAVTSRAPSVREIRSGSLGRSGSTRSRRRSSGEREKPEVVRDSRGFVEAFAPVTEEVTRVEEGGGVDGDGQHGSTIIDKEGADAERRAVTPVYIPDSTPLTSQHERERSDHDRTIPPLDGMQQRTHTSGYRPPPKLPWTTSTILGLQAFWRWFLTPFGFLLTLYGLNVVAWGGMLFLLLCNASPAMCHAPVPNAANRKHMPPAASLALPGPYYFNCNDINSPRRVWIEIDSQILNALFCVTGFGLVPWRFRDLYYLLRWRFTSERSAGRDAKLYGLRVLAGIHKGWFRLPGSETLDSLSTPDYLTHLSAQNAMPSVDHTPVDVESASSSLPEHDPRIALPLSKQPPFPPTSVRAPPTKLWKLDFFIWCQCWNTFFQCCLCGFMWGMDRYARPPWSTGLFVALACIIAGVGGVVSYIEGKRVKKVEGVFVKEEGVNEAKGEGDVGYELEGVRTGATGHESVHIWRNIKDGRYGG